MIRTIDYLVLSIAAAAIAWTLAHQLVAGVLPILARVTAL